MAEIPEVLEEKPGRELPLKDANGLEKNQCPVCGYRFYDDVHEFNICPKGHQAHGEVFTPEQLITEDDDYLYCV